MSTILKFESWPTNAKPTSGDVCQNQRNHGAGSRPVQPFLADLKDLQVVLGQDLTIAGIDAAKDPIAKTKSEGAKVQQTLDKVIAELNTVVATITPAKAKK